jgi:hypothetical protein
MIFLENKDNLEVHRRIFLNEKWSLIFSDKDEYKDHHIGELRYKDDPYIFVSHTEKEELDKFIEEIIKITPSSLDYPKSSTNFISLVEKFFHKNTNISYIIPNYAFNPKVERIVFSKEGLFFPYL